MVKSPETEIIICSLKEQPAIVSVAITSYKVVLVGVAVGSRPKTPERLSAGDHIYSMFEGFPATVACKTVCSPKQISSSSEVNDKSNN